MKAQSRRLNSVGSDYLQVIAADLGGKKAAVAGQNAANRYLSGKEKGGAQLKAAAFVAGTSAVAMALFLAIGANKENKAPETPHVKSAPELGCTVEVNKSAGLGTAWDIAKVVSPKGSFEEVFQTLAEQSYKAGGYLHNGDILWLPAEDCGSSPVLVTIGHGPAE